MARKSVDQIDAAVGMGQRHTLSGAVPLEVDFDSVFGPAGGIQGIGAAT